MAPNVINMFAKTVDILTIGDMTTDAFIRLKDADIHCRLKHEDCEICLPFGSKVPFESVKVIQAVGNAANAAVAAARLGLRAVLVSNLGDDQNGKNCLVELRKNGVETGWVKVHKNKPTNYHFVLWYGNERTILVNHIAYDYRLPKLPQARWVYLTSLAPDSLHYHESISDWLLTNPSTKLAFQPGTFQISLGYEGLKRIYARTDVLVVNKEEAKKILSRTPVIDPSDIKVLLKSLANLGPKIVIITDNTAGACMFDGDHYYKMPMYPDPRPAIERTGCGDAFAATFVSALAMGKPPLEALTWAPINPMSVAQFVGAQEGLLTREQVEWWLERAPGEYRPKEI